MKRIFHLLTSMILLFSAILPTAALAESPTRDVQQVNCGPPSTRIFLPTIRTIFNLLTPEANKQSSPQSDGQASWGSPIAVSSLGGLVWTVNPDSGSVSVIDPQSQAKVAEIMINGEPWSLAIAPNGSSVYVADRATGEVTEINGRTFAVEDVLDVGPELGQIALSPSGAIAYATLISSNQIAVIDTQPLSVTALIPVDQAPYAIGVTNDGDLDDYDEQILVTHFYGVQTPDGVEGTDTNRVGRISMLDACSHEITTQIAIQPNTNGFPNLLAGLSIHQQRAWVTLVRAAPDLPTTLTTTVFAAVATLDLADEQEVIAAGLPLNDQAIFGSPINNPVMAVPSPDGARLYVVAAGSDLIEVVDVADPTHPKLIGFLPVGRNPRGMAINADGSEGYVMNYLSRALSIVDLTQMESVAEVPVTAETLSAAVLQGKLLFNNAVDPRLSRGSWISCASCHPDGGTDNVTWMFPDGPRQTPPIWNSMQTLPWHWSAALDEPHDVEETIHIIQHGLGLATGTDPAQLGAPNAGRSADLDALVDFMASGIRVPHLPIVPETQTAATLTTTVAAGREIFQSAGCGACHGGPNWTTSALTNIAGTLDSDGNGMIDALLHDVGTLNERDVRGQSGFDSPSLLNVELTPPYFHDGSMASLDALLRSGHPNPTQVNLLDDETIIQLVHFLRTIDPSTLPIALQKSSVPHLQKQRRDKTFLESYINTVP